MLLFPIPLSANLKIIKPMWTPAQASPPAWFLTPAGLFAGNRLCMKSRRFLVLSRICWVAVEKFEEMCRVGRVLRIKGWKAALSSSVRLAWLTSGEVEDPTFLKARVCPPRKVWSGSRAAEMILGVTGGIGSHWFIPLGVGTLNFLVQTISLGLRISNQEEPGKGSGETSPAGRGSCGCPSPECSSRLQLTCCCRSNIVLISLFGGGQNQI